MSRLRKFLASWQNRLALGLIALFVLMALAAPLLSPADPNGDDPAFKLLTVSWRTTTPQPPRPEAPLGTLHNGADVFHTLMWGARDALIFGISVTAVIFFIGTLLGTLSAYYRNFFGRFLLWFTDTMLAFPIIVATVLFYNAYRAFLLKTVGAETYELARGMTYYFQALSPLQKFVLSIDPVSLSFALFLWMPYARVMNSSVRKVMQNEYILAAKASGVKNWRIIYMHIIPNAIHPLISMAAKDIGALAVLQSALTYLGVGKGSPWAALLLMGRNYMFANKGVFTFWWIFVPTSLAIVLFGLAWSFLGDGLNAALDPKDNA